MASAVNVPVAAITGDVIDPSAVSAAVAGDGVGGTVVFVGTVRDRDDGRAVVQLSYSAHPSAAGRLRSVLADAVGAFDVVAAAASHRVGDLVVGDVAVVVAVSAAHRSAAFAACGAAVDRIKAEVPIWKHQTFSDGTQEWVGAPDAGLGSG